MTPLRQFPQLANHAEVIRRIEKKEQLQWHHYVLMTEQQIGEALKHPEVGPVIKRYVTKFPRSELKASACPVTPSTLLISVVAEQDFHWD